VRRLEEKLLNYFRIHEGKTLCRDVLARDVWVLKLDRRSRCIDQTVASLRRHLGIHERIVTVCGSGYRYERLRE
jgi:DNA-binding response OmpR family regulator